MSRARIGVIGAGFWAAYHYLPFFRDSPDVDLVGIVRKTDDGLDAFRLEFGLEIATSSVAELLEAGLDGVVVSSPHSLHREHAVAALEAGAHVLVEKPMAVKRADAALIVAAAEAAGRTVSVAHGWNYSRLAIWAKDMLEEGRIGTVRAFRTTQLQASTDPLTGLMNRRTLENELGPIVRSGELVAVAIGDVDHFKKLNDTYGHESGDRALRILGDALQASVRGGDLVCRYGGEEFVMAFPGLSARDAAEVLERIRTTIAMNLQGREVPAFTISFGVTDSTRSTTLDELLRIADGGLYQAKAAGRDRVVIAGLAPGVHSSEPLPDEVDELPDADLDLVASGAGA